MTTMTTREELAKAAQEALAVHEAAVAALANVDERSAEALASSQRAWDIALVERHRELDASLMAEARQKDDELSRAVAEGDLNAAVIAWMERHAARNARRLIRTAATGAENVAQTGANMLPDDLRYYSVDMFAEIERAAEHHASNLAADMFDHLVGDRPTELLLEDR